MPKTSKDSIKYVGLKDWLNGSKAKHDGHDYDFFVDVFTKGVSKSNIARMFKVDRQTVIKWCAVYDAEREL